MVVGRALNGWPVSAYPEEFATSVFREEFTRKVQESVNGPDPMAWVQEQWGAAEGYKHQAVGLLESYPRGNPVLVSNGWQW